MTQKSHGWVLPCPWLCFALYKLNVSLSLLVAGLAQYRVKMRPTEPVAHGVPVSFDQGSTAALGPGVAVKNEYLILVRKILRRVTADKSGSSGDEHVSHMAASPDFSGSFIPERHFLLLSFLLGHKPQVLQNP